MQESEWDEISLVSRAEACMQKESFGIYHIRYAVRAGVDASRSAIPRQSRDISTKWEK